MAGVTEERSGPGGANGLRAAGSGDGAGGGAEGDHYNGEAAAH